MECVHLIISGDVVGVGFRAWTRRLARSLSLTGWVKNREDNAVEIVAVGSRVALENLIKACQHGPEVAWVESVRTTWEEAGHEFVGFEVLY